MIKKTCGKCWFFSPFQLFRKITSAFCQSFPEGLSELHSACPENHFEVENTFLQKPLISSPLSDSRKEKYHIENHFQRAVETAIYVSTRSIWGSFWTIYFLKSGPGMSEKWSAHWRILSIWLWEHRSTCPAEWFETIFWKKKQIRKSFLDLFPAGNFWKKIFPLLFWTLSRKLADFWWKFVGRVVNASLYPSSGTFWLKTTFIGKKIAAHWLPTLNKDDWSCWRKNFDMVVETIFYVSGKTNWGKDFSVSI